MRHILIIFSIFLFSLTIISCGEDPFFKLDTSDNITTSNDTTTTDTTAPVITAVTAVTTPTTDTTPDYTFSSDEAGTITYGGSCSSTTTSAISGNNTITLVSLSDGTYSDCTIKVTDTTGNVSNTLTLTSFDVIPSYVAVGSSGIILTSSDGTTWTSRTSGTSNSPGGVTSR